MCSYSTTTFVFVFCRTAGWRRWVGSSPYLSTLNPLYLCPLDVFFCVDICGEIQFSCQDLFSSEIIYYREDHLGYTIGINLKLCGYFSLPPVNLTSHHTCCCCCCCQMPCSSACRQAAVGTYFGAVWWLAGEDLAVGSCNIFCEYKHLFFHHNILPWFPVTFPPRYGPCLRVADIYPCLVSQHRDTFIFKPDKNKSACFFCVHLCFI